MPPSPASTRKSERFEKQTPTAPPVKRKLMTVEKHVPNVLRRSERGNKQSSSSSSGSKKSEKSSSSPDAKKPKEKREKSVKQLILETKEIEKQDTKLAQMKKKKTWNARAYLAFLVQDGSNQVNASDQGKELNRLDTPDNDMSRGRNSKQVHNKHDVQRPLDVVSEDSFSSLNKTGVGISTPSPKLTNGGKAVEVEDGDGLQKSKSYDSAHADCTLYKKTGSPELPESTIFGMRGDANISLVAIHKVASLKRKRDLDMDTDTEGKRTETSRTYLKRQSMSRTSHTECEGGRTVRDAQKSLYLRLKPEISKLCETLQLSEEIKGMVEKFFKYVMNNHSISKEPLQAFQISLCWIAASLLKKKIDQKQSVVLAQQHLNFSCNDEEASHVYLKLRCLKHLFLYHSCYDKIANSSRVSSLSSKDTFGSPNASKHQQEDIVGCSLSIKELVERDISTAIKRLKKTCDMQLSNLISMQHKEVNEVYRSYEEEKVELEKKHRTELAVIRCLDRSSAGADRLKILENAFASKIEQQKKQFNTNIVDLMERQSSARKKVEQKFAHLEDDVKSWLQVELLNRLPSDESGCVLENPQISKEQYPGNAPLVQSECTFPQGDPLHLSQSQAFQDQCSLPSLSIEMPDGDQPGSKEGNDAGQSEASPSLPNDDTVQSDYNFEASAIEPVVQPQLSPDISPDENPLDLSSAGEIGHTPSTQEQNGSDIDAQYVGCHEASVMETLHGHVLQDQCSMLSISTEMQDGDAPGTKERHATEQVEVPQSNPNDVAVPYADEPSSKKGNETGQGEAPQSHPNDDTVQSDYKFEAPTIIEPVVQDEGEPSSKEGNISGQGEAPQSHPKDDTVLSEYNLEASTIEPVVQSQLSPTDTSPNDNPLDLSSAGEIGHLPITQEQSGTHNDVQSGGNCEASVREPVVHVSPMDFSSGHNQPDLPSSGEFEYQTRTENDLPSGVEIEYQHSNEVQNVTAEVEPPPRSQSIDALPSEHRIHETVVREPVLQLQLPASLDSTPGYNPLLASRPLGDDPQCRQIQPTHVGSRMPLPLSLDPLQNELDRIRKDMDHSIKIYEDKKLQLKADCKKEIEEVIAQTHKKYEIKLQESEVEFSHKKKEMDASHNKLLMNKILAEAFRCKCMDDRASGIPGIQQDIMTSFRQQPGRRSPSVTSLSVTSAQHPTLTIPQSTLPAPGLHATSSSQQPVYYSRPLVSTPTISSRTSPISHSAMSLQGGSGIRAPSSPLLTSPISHPAMSRQGGSVIRSPAPHLKRFRPPASLPLSNTLPLPFDLPSQQPTNTVIPPSIPLSSSSILPHSHRMPSQPTPNTVNSSTPLPPSSLHPLPCRTSSQLAPNTTSYPSTPLSSTNTPPFSYSMPAPDTASSPISLSSTILPPLPSRIPGQRTPNNHPSGPSSSALEFMDVDRRYGATLPDILSPLPDLGFSGLGLHGIGSYVGSRAPRASSSGDIVCLSDDD